MSAVEEVLPEPPPKGFFAKLAEGLKFWKFGPKEWAVWQASSYVTLAQLAAGNAVWVWLKTNWAVTIVPFVKNAALAAIQILKEYMSSEIEVEDGEIIASSKGLHLYDYSFDLAKIRTYTMDDK